MNRQAVLYSVAAGVGVIGASIGLYWLGRELLHNRRHHHRDAEGTVNESVSLHYTPTDECTNYPFVPKEAGDFPKRLAEFCIRNMSEGVLSRALDVGCGPGGVSFELAREFSEVVGLDYSQAFVAKCQELKMTGQTTYWLPTEANLREQKVAYVDAGIDRSRVQFTQGDACNLPQLGQFGCVLAANVITRLSDPMKFLARVPDIIVPGGILVIASYYYWEESSTPKEKWLGGFMKDGREVQTFDTLKEILSLNFDLVEAVDLSLLSRCTERMYQWSVDHVTVWKRKPQRP